MSGDTKYKPPAYMHDAPKMLTGVTAILASTAVEAMSASIKEAYPLLNEHSLEYGQLLAAVFHHAEWLCLNSQLKGST